MAKALPTDLELLRAIFDEHYDAFVAYTDDKPNRDNRMWVPVNLDAIAKRFGTDSPMIFGRLYYHMNQKYGEVQLDGTRLDFFQLVVGRDSHCINFPFLASVLADLQQDQRRFAVATGIAVLSLVVSLLSIVIAVFAP